MDKILRFRILIYFTTLVKFLFWNKVLHEPTTDNPEQAFDLESFIDETQKRIAKYRELSSPLKEMSIYSVRAISLTESDLPNETQLAIKHFRDKGHFITIKNTSSEKYHVVINIR